MVFKLCEQVVSVSKEFENDVKMYGIQTLQKGRYSGHRFENDVKMYGIQTKPTLFASTSGLRMM